MNPTRQQELQKQWRLEQKNIMETISSTDKAVTITFNGNVEVLELKIQKDMPVDQLVPVIITCINAGIKNASVKAQQAFEQFRRVHNL